MILAKLLSWEPTKIRHIFTRKGISTCHCTLEIQHFSSHFAILCTYIFLNSILTTTGKPLSERIEYLFRLHTKLSPELSMISANQLVAALIVSIHYECDIRSRLAIEHLVNKDSLISTCLISTNLISTSLLSIFFGRLSWFGICNLHCGVFLQNMFG